MATISTIANSDFAHSNFDNLSTPPNITPSKTLSSSLHPIFCPHKAIEALEISTDIRDEIILLILFPSLPFEIVDNFVEVPSSNRGLIVTRSASGACSFPLYR